MLTDDSNGDRRVPAIQSIEALGQPRRFCVPPGEVLLLQVRQGKGTARRASHVVRSARSAAQPQIRVRLQKMGVTVWPGSADKTQNWFRRHDLDCAVLCLRIYMLRRGLSQVTCRDQRKPV